LRSFIWGNLTLLVLVGLSLSFPGVRIKVADALDGTAKILYKSVDKDEFNFDYWFEKLNKK